MQSKVGGMARPRHPQDRVVQRGGREVTASGQAYAHAVEDHRTYCWKDRNAVLREVSEALG